MRLVAFVVAVVASMLRATTSQECENVSCRWRGAVEKRCQEEEGFGLLRRIGIIYYGPASLASGDVGLERAVEIWEASSQRRVTWLNTALLEGARVAYHGEVCDFLRKHFDHVIVKSNWDYVVDRFVREHLWTANDSGCPLTRSLQIAGSYPPPSRLEALRFYDVLYYETHWYAKTFLSTERHPRKFHAFGADVDAMRDHCRRARTIAKKSYDWLFVGAFADHAGFKRPELIGHRQGRRLAVGKLRDNSLEGPNVSTAAAAVVDALRTLGVDVRPPVPWGFPLASLLVDTYHVLVPDHTFGGGERLVLEARACDTDVAIEPDNPKLDDLQNGPLYSPLYYAGQLEKGILQLEHDLRQQQPRIQSSTCGVASLLGGGSSATAAHCWRKTDAVLARADLSTPLL